VLKPIRRARPYGRLRALKQSHPSEMDIALAALSARNDLAAHAPLLSGKAPAGRVLVGVMVITLVAALFGALNVEIFRGVWLALCCAFAALGMLRFAMCFFPIDIATLPKIDKTPNATPIWTILIALYKEADSVGPLLLALSKLEWAQSRLDIIFACEADDDETLQALSNQRKHHNFRIVRVPSGGPRTKPHALQTALPFAQGRFLTVYDAEDRPSPQQLRAAFQAFIGGKPNLAVVQAPLVVWNLDEGWIARQFALDYAIWFRVMLPAFAGLSGLIPLGGTSNHFKTEVLRAVGGWDPYNVTEDADLGVRLARYGFVSGLISPPTYEEAPPKIGAWVKQRGRWIQGHIQTFSLHLRTPFILSRELGWRGLIAFFIGLGIGPMSALISLPLGLGIGVSFGLGINSGNWMFLALGLIAQFMTAVLACYRDGRWRLLTSLFTLPLYHGLQSVAACRAMWRVVFTPAIWDKTDHGSAARTAKTKGQVRWTGQQHC
jgi:glycosyltransferase XagB